MRCWRLRECRMLTGAERSPAGAGFNGKRSRLELVGRTPRSAADALVGLWLQPHRQAVSDLAVSERRGWQQVTNVAVGMAVSDHPRTDPYSQELLHTVLTLDVTPLGVWRRSEHPDRHA